MGVVGHAQRRIGLAAGMACAAVLSQLAVPSSAFAQVQTDAVAGVPLATVTNWRVDEAAGRIFYDDAADGRGDGTGVVATDLAGASAVAIAGTAGAGALSVAPDGSKVFAAEWQRQRIVAIDVASLQVVATYETGSSVCPTDVAATGTRVWFGYTSCEAPGPSGLGYVDVSQSPASIATGFGEGDDLGWSQLAWSPGSPAVLIVNSESGDLIRYDLSAGTPVLSGARYHYLEQPDSWLCATNDLAESADGSSLFLLCPYTVRVVSTTDLTNVRTYDAVDQAHPQLSREGGGIVVAPDGSRFVIGMRLGGLDAADVFDTSSGEQIDTYVFGECGSTGTAYANCVHPNGLQVGATGVIYALTSTGPYPTSSYPTLHTLADHTMAPVELTLSAPATAVHDSQILISGRLTSSGQGLGRSRPVSLLRHDAEGDRWLPDAVADPDGNFTASVPIGVAGDVSFTARYFGDEHHPETTGSATVHVPKIAPTLEPPLPPGPYRYATITGVQGRLVPAAWPSGGTMTLSATPAGLSRRVIATGSAPVDTRWTLRRNTTFTVDYSGDNRYLPASTQSTALVHALVGDHLARYDAHTAAGTPVYRRGQSFSLLTHVLPNHAGECVHDQLQQYLDSSWQPVATSRCLRLNDESRVSWTYLPHKAFGLYRVRTTIAPDTINIGSASQWLHLRYTE